MFSYEVFVQTVGGSVKHKTHFDKHYLEGLVSQRPIRHHVSIWNEVLRLAKARYECKIT